MCLIKNEVDVVEQTLRAATAWCDHLYVYDNGSDDGTWELVRGLAEELPQLIAFKQDGKPFADRLRSEIFAAYRDRSGPDDWWCLLDSDEFYIDDPRTFLAAVPPRYSTVWTASLDYFFTDRDAEAYRADASAYADSVPVEQRLRYYLNHWSELRFYRYDPRLTWRGAGSSPDGLERRPPHPVRIRQRHFSYRSPTQIDKRMRTRRAAVDVGAFVHESDAGWTGVVGVIEGARGGPSGGGPVRAGTGTWTDRVVPADALDYDAHDGTFVLNEDLMPPLPTATSVRIDRIRRPVRRASRVARRWARRVS